MGPAVPATPTYIILASIAALAPAQLGTHFFVFHYGVLANATPPVALVVGHPGATALAAPAVLLILVWHWRSGQRLALAAR